MATDHSDDLNLMQYSLKNLHNYVPERVDPRRIGIIGGKGAMGQLLEREFKKDGYEVITTGENPTTGATGRLSALPYIR